MTTGVLVATIFYLICVIDWCGAMSPRGASVSISPRSAEILDMLDLTDQPPDNSGYASESLLKGYRFSYYQLIAKCFVPLRQADNPTDKKVIIDSCISADKCTLLLLNNYGELYAVDLTSEQLSNWRVTCDGTAIAMKAICPCPVEPDYFLCVTCTGFVYRLNVRDLGKQPQIVWSIDSDTVGLSAFPNQNMLLSKNAAGVLKLWHHDTILPYDVSVKIFSGSDWRISAYDFVPEDESLYMCTTNGTIGWSSVVDSIAVTKLIAKNVPSSCKIMYIGNGLIALLTMEGDLCLYSLSQNIETSFLQSLAKCPDAEFVSITGCACSADKCFLIGMRQDGMLLVWENKPPYKRLFACSPSVYTPLKSHFVHQIDQNWFVLVGQNGSVSKVPLLFLLNASVQQLLLIAKLCSSPGSPRANKWHAGWRAIYESLPHRIKTVLGMGL